MPPAVPPHPQALQGLTHMALWLTVPLLMAPPEEPSTPVPMSTSPGGQAAADGAPRPHPGCLPSAVSPDGPMLDGWEAWHQVGRGARGVGGWGETKC